MNQDKKQLIEAGEQAVERARTDSKQPRFKGDGQPVGFGSIFPWMRDKWKSLIAPEYKLDSRERDQWLRQFSKIEPHWAFVLNQCAQIDANRGWMMIGGRNQVARYTRMMHNAEEGQGWRTFAKKASKAYRTADMGTVVETGRQTMRGPLRSLYNVDPARCKLTGKPDLPLKYYPKNGRVQQWRPTDFFRAVSSPSTDEAMYDLGYCATSIALEIIRLFYGVFQHDQEMVGARMPEGLLVLQGISETDWNDALESRKQQLDAKGQRWFGNIMAIAGSGLETASVTLVSLSQLPANFDRETFINMSMYAYAGVVGYAPSEFWPVSSGALGRGREEEIGAVRATSKGGRDWSLSFQDRLQMELPDSLQFEFEERDDLGRKQQADVARAWADVTDVLRKRQGELDEGTITREEARMMLVDAQVIPPEWTEVEEETQATDTDDSGLERIRQRLLTLPAVLRAVEMYADEPIIRYHWDGVQGRTRILWQRGGDALRRKSFPVARVARQVIGGDVLFEGDDVIITQGDVDRALVDSEQRLGADGPVELMLATEEETEE